jgi:hypothetical protein
MTEQQSDTPDYDGGLNALIDDAQAMLEEGIDGTYGKINWNRARVARCRAVAQALDTEWIDLRTELAQLSTKWIGSAPPARIADETQGPAPAILPPKHRPTPDEFSRVANQLTEGDRPPRFLQRASR